MKHKLTAFLLITIVGFSQPLQTCFENSNGLETVTYFEAINFYKQLDKASNKILLKEMGPTDVGYNLHVVLFTDGKFDATARQSQGKVVVMVNNGIHPGEPDGIDASMMFLRDLATGVPAKSPLQTWCLA